MVGLHVRRRWGGIRALIDLAYLNISKLRERLKRAQLISQLSIIDTKMYAVRLELALIERPVSLLQI